jgi:alkanesulfonate monooxygenase SsuD/methylene tetrahydromethanopterin reductase-like flavin-dependent oxidoreductase (luciferase family)
VIQLGILQNGASDLPVADTPSGVLVAGGSLADMHTSFQRILVDQVRQGVLAEQLGYDFYFMTEHHFQPEGPEFSPNPLMAEMAIAAHTRRIRLGQATNILTQWHPLRVAELGAMLDVISGGRVEFGVGRGYQPREVEVLGFPYGASIQDQERNRAYFQEAYDMIIKAWTQLSFSHQGQFFTIPPTYTRWNHTQTLAYFRQPHVGRALEDVVRIGPPDQYGGGNPVTNTTTVLKEISLFPQPLQKPYLQCWEPVASARSGAWAAAHGVNCNLNALPRTRAAPGLRALLPGGRAGGLAGPPVPWCVQVRLGCREAARPECRPLGAHSHAGRRAGPARADRPGARDGVELLRPVWLHRGFGRR